MKKLVRFRADPTKVRVALRRQPNGEWACSITSRAATTLYALNNVSAHVARSARTPRGALFLALHAAAYVHMPGIDLAMGSAYEHPFLEAEVRA